MHFRPFEFECKCRYECGKGFAHMDEDFLGRLERARIYANVKFKLNSAYRCLKHNTDVGGSEGSAHTIGFAVDIATPNSNIRERVIYGIVKAGFHRFGIYENFIHVDDDPARVPNVAWFGD